MKLKKYQDETLAALGRFLDAAAKQGPRAAYEAVTGEPAVAERLRGWVGPYRPLDRLPDTPYVCLRLPTGGGKTILAAHAIALARDYLEREFPLVLWLVPSNAIRSQTADALKDPRHPYRKELDDTFKGRVRIFDITDFAAITPQDLRANLCIVVGTIQTLRVENTEGRKVYADHEMLETHFDRLKPTATNLERVEKGPRKGEVKYSFANLLHIHRPLMIVDEAHNAVTGLSEVMQQRVNPAAIIEFTATPRKRSNILYNVTARELKAEEMVKLPIVLSEHKTWQDAVTGALATRAVLAEEALKDRDYIRPIVLFQAQNRDREVNVEALKAHLIEVQGVDPAEIAVATGEERGLEGYDLMKEGPIRYVITVQALKEGWDCPFAYVFCSVADISSAGDVEQLLGRVLRMPYAKRRASANLNKAYASVSSPSFAAAAHALKDRLVNMGFDEEEARENIEAEQGALDDGAGFGSGRRRPSVEIEVEADPAALDALNDLPSSQVRIVRGSGGKAAVKFTGVPSRATVQRIAAALPTPQATAFREAVEAYIAENTRYASPATEGATFTVPALMAMIQGELELLDPDSYIEFAGFDLSQQPARLEAAEFDITETADVFEIDLDGSRLRYRALDEDDQLKLDLVEVEGWSQDQLTAWLARHVQDEHIGHGQMVAWLSDVVTYLTGPRGLSVAALNRCKFPLMRRLREKVATLKRAALEAVHQKALFAPDALPSVSQEHGFEFREGVFADVKRYAGAYEFRRHFLGPLDVPAFDGVEAGEEFQCAQQLDRLSEVEFWVRNVRSHHDAFWLPKKDGRFFPDFVAKLKDGRLFVVEYKGADRATNEDSDEKRAIGRVWQDCSKGAGIFLMVEKEIDGADMRQQMRAAISRSPAPNEG